MDPANALRATYYLIVFAIECDQVPDEVRRSLELVRTCNDDLQHLIEIRNECLPLLQARPVVLGRVNKIIEAATLGLTEVSKIIEKCRPEANKGKTSLGRRAAWVFIDSAEFKSQVPTISRHHASVLAELNFLRQILLLAPVDLEKKAKEPEGKKMIAFDNVALLGDLLGNMSVSTPTPTPQPHRVPSVPNATLGSVGFGSMLTAPGPPPPPYSPPRDDIPHQRSLSTSHLHHNNLLAFPLTLHGQYQPGHLQPNAANLSRLEKKPSQGNMDFSQLVECSLSPTPTTVQVPMGNIGPVLRKPIDSYFNRPTADELREDSPDSQPGGNPSTYSARHRTHTMPNPQLYVPPAPRPYVPPPKDRLRQCQTQQPADTLPPVPSPVPPPSRPAWEQRMPSSTSFYGFADRPEHSTPAGLPLQVGQPASKPLSTIPAELIYDRDDYHRRESMDPCQPPPPLNLARGRVPSITGVPWTPDAAARRPITQPNFQPSSTQVPLHDRFELHGAVKSADLEEPDWQGVRAIIKPEVAGFPGASNVYNGGFCGGSLNELP